MHQAHLFISGFVQGVGFRYFVRSQAISLGLCGWVRNVPDSRVEVVIQGSKKKIEALIAHCQLGPVVSNVEQVDVVWESVTTQLTKFVVK